MVGLEWVAIQEQYAPDALNSLQFGGLILRSVLNGLWGKWGGRGCGVAARDQRSGVRGGTRPVAGVSVALDESLGLLATTDAQIAGLLRSSAEPDICAKALK
jgi:hypothetical protein